MHFMDTLLPTFEIKDEYIVKLVVLKQEIPDTDKGFVNKISDAIERLVRVREIRKYALSHEL